MSCEWQNKLDVYVDCELPAAESAALETHLRTCQSCAAEALSRMQLKRLTHQAAANSYAPTAEFRRRVADAISIRPKSSWRWLPQIGLAAAVVVIVLAATFLWLGHSHRQQAREELADLHLATLASANPVEVVSSDRHTVKPWFAGKLPFTFNLPEFQNTRFRLLGGRVTYFEQNPGAQLLIDAGRHQVSVFIFHDGGEVGRLGSGLSKTRNGFTFESWSEGELRFVAISDAEPATVEELAELMRAAERR